MRLSFFKPATLPDAGPLYAAVVAEARRPDWYLAAGVPDTLDGRFAILTSLLALTDIRLERGDDSARAFGPRLAEQFIADMDAQMREAGFGDPSLGKQVRTMVGSLASRVDRWRLAVEAVERWEEVAVASLYPDGAPNKAAGDKGVEATRAWWQKLQQAGDSALVRGEIA